MEPKGNLLEEDVPAFKKIDREVLEKLPRDFKQAIEFHGHLCPGLTIGYRAAKIAMERLGVQRGSDEELLGIVETDACGSDAFQVITGCTFGRGNFLYKDYGKQVFTLVKRSDGRGVRVAMKYNVLPAGTDHSNLMQKVMAGLADEEERMRFSRLHLERALKIYELPDDEFASISEVEIDLPPKAKIFPSVQCAYCGEGVMEPRARLRDGKYACIPCATRYARGWEINA